MKNVTEMSDISNGYYVSAKRWLSDLEFFKIETAFLIHLKRDYFFTRLADLGDPEKLETIGNKLVLLVDDIHQTVVQVHAQLKQLELVAENDIVENIKNLGETNTILESLMTNLTNEYREVKKQLFLCIEVVVRETEFLAG
ncbi:hypothetical protein [Mucilaginibacter sp. FT3.2]|uniref:hypothetical protein n=1 Tax=Mucilaginibacter sp. FT3.2 TaxID=2723090 RepID=UPI001622A9EC|nr:hypothetical protein [Mucilaginibacter sp. FT3.2]MBB6235134.1 hypothetical protein [Mucilaginibacter sp. FT3.2]